MNEMVLVVTIFEGCALRPDRVNPQVRAPSGGSQSSSWTAAESVTTPTSPYETITAGDGSPMAAQIAR